MENSVLLEHCALLDGVRFRCTVSKKSGNELFSDGRNMPEERSPQMFFHSTALLYIHPDLHLDVFPFYGLTLHSPRLTSRILSILRPNFTFIQTYISNSFHSTALLYIHPDLHLNSFPFYALTLHSPTLTSRLLSILRPYFTFTQTYISTAFHSTALQLHSSRTSNTWVSTIHIIRSVYFQAECTERLLRALVGVCG